MALYLKYRPKDFTSLVGQGFIKETLQKAVEQDKTVGAYLFTGPRGTGKTSTARIFAKAINCSDSKDGNPCLKCDVCTSFHDNKLIDIIEIDAASHTGVDNIREIIERAQFQPTKTKYKIYIIDEVHMLSKGAFNALLKILEEPPAHVKFILATTEIHKVPETILSRCQRYDFKNHTPEDTSQRLTYIAKEEKVTIDEDSLNYIVKTSGGGLRDAISLFEQLIVDNKITYDYITQTLGISKAEEIQSFADKLIGRDTSVLTELSQIEESGKDIQLFFRDVLLYIGNQTKQQLEEGKDISENISVLDTLHDTCSKAKQSFDQALTFRIGVMKVLSDYTAVPTVIARNDSDVAISPIGGNPSITSQGRTKLQEDTEPLSVKTKKTVKDTTTTSQGKDISGGEKSSEGKQIPSDLPEQDTSLFSEAQDVFAPEEPAFDQERASRDSQPSFGKETSGGDFDKEAFISEVKKIGAKGAITMSLRGADFTLIDDTLKIQFKTKIALGSVNIPENIEYLNKALESLNKSHLSLELA